MSEDKTTYQASREASAPAADSLTRLQDLLRELFQLTAQADLDFGIYRLLHLKRAEVEAFLTKQLPETVEREFKKLAGDEQKELSDEVTALANQIRETLGDEAMAGDKVAPEYAKTKLADKYDKKRGELLKAQATEEYRRDVFNHLYSFFSRYYDEGDFIPRKHSGGRGRYAVPYNGEEVLFHWANKDQHYIKTVENFQDYTFWVKETLHGDYRVRLKLVEATIPKDNTKGETRFFFPQPGEVSYDKAAKTLTVPFHYRLPTGKEVEKYGANTKGQDAVLVAECDKIIQSVEDAVLQSELRKPVKKPEEVKKSKEKPEPILLKRLRHFTKRNTTDYFIHKRLREFLTGELEFYIRDQIISSIDLKSDFETKRRLLRVFEAVAGDIIVFLAEVEEAQKRLFEKRKFVLQADYLVPMQNVPRELWKEVVANEQQVNAWKNLFGIAPKKDLLNRKGEINEQFLQEHPTLVVSTAHFGAAFRDRLLASFKDLDGVTDGLLIHAENYQALRLLQKKFTKSVDAIYNDPPYNTGKDFIYKDAYKRSSWVAKIKALNSLLHGFLRSKGALFTSVDDNEYSDLLAVNEVLFGEEANATVIRVNPSTKSWAEFLSVTHDYCVVSVRSGDAQSAPGPWRIRKPYVDEFKKRTKALLKMKLTDEEKRMNLRELVKIPMFKAFDHYTEFDDKGIYRSGNPNRTLQSEGAQVFPDVVLMHDVTKKKCTLSDNWRFNQEKTDELASRKPTGFHFGPDHTTVPGVKNYLEEYEEMTPQSVMFDDTQVDTKTILPGMGLKFDFPKPLSFVRRLVEMSTGEHSLVADCYAGSGTTGHAVIDINREDGKGRKFLLIDFADYFDTTLLKRIQKVMYAPAWKGGEPSRMPTKVEVVRTPRLVKVLRLESYEDALHNLVTTETSQREETRAKAHKKLGEENYRLSYMLKLPVEASLLNLAKLEHPFKYEIEVLTDGGPEKRIVDLVETFNYLYGLHVQRIETWLNAVDGNRGYRVVKGMVGERQKPVMVLWRDMAGLDPKIERTFIEAKLAEDLTGYDEKWINGDSAAGFKSLDGEFKRLMEEPDRES